MGKHIFPPFKKIWTLYSMTSHRLVPVSNGFRKDPYLEWLFKYFNVCITCCRKNMEVLVSMWIAWPNYFISTEIPVTRRSLQLVLGKFMRPEKSCWSVKKAIRTVIRIIQKGADGWQVVACSVSQKEIHHLPQLQRLAVDINRKVLKLLTFLEVGRKTELTIKSFR